jgi:hypothetical protein
MLTVREHWTHNRFRLRRARQVEQIGCPDVLRPQGLSMPQTWQVRVGGTQQR